MASKKKDLYPVLTISRIKNPSHFYAFPLFGFILKCIMLIPVGIYVCLLSIANIFVWIINSFYIICTGKYWKVAYDLNTGLIRLMAKMTFFLYGMTDTYPGFSFEIDDSFSITIPYPKKPSKLFAIPIVGFLIRWILVIPYVIYQAIISRAALIALVVGSFFVIFTGKYPESDFEINRDAFRISLATSMWFVGLSDIYPSFWISMKHKTIKIVLIILSVLLVGASYGPGFMGHRSPNSLYQQKYFNTNNSVPSNNYYNYNQK